MTDGTTQLRLPKTRGGAPYTAHLEPYLSWSRVPPRGNVFPHVVRASRALRHEECRKIAHWCAESIGRGFFQNAPMGGNLMGIDLDWIGDADTMHFRDETNMVIFVLAFTGC